jgi:peptide/nickel transport system permease protein
MGVLGPGIVNLVVVLSITGWPHFFRLMRGEVLVEREKAYVEAAQALGAHRLTIMLRHIARNVAHTFFVVATVRLGLAVLSEAGLSYLGFGVPPGIPAWGSMIAAGQDYVETAWWLSAAPGLAILLLVLCVNLLGEGLRDAFDPRMRP